MQENIKTRFYKKGGIINFDFAFRNRMARGKLFCDVEWKIRAEFAKDDDESKCGIRISSQVENQEWKECQ